MSTLWWLLGAVGISGAGIGIAALLGGGPAMLGIAFKAWNFAKGLSPRTWLYIAAGVALVIGVIWHESLARKALKDADTTGYNRAQAEDAKVIAAMRARAQTAEANGLKISQEVRTRNDTDNRNINASAAALSLRGPGAASCRRVGDPAIPASASGRVAGDRPTSPAADTVLADNGLAAVPWDWLVNTGREADLDRAEVLSWREWYTRQAAEWEKLRAKP